VASSLQLTISKNFRQLLMIRRRDSFTIVTPAAKRGYAC
jgi:hypothetical protein